MAIPLKKLKQINNALSVAVILLSAYIALSPVVPYAIVTLGWGNKFKTLSERYVYKSNAAEHAGLSQKELDQLRPIPGENRLLIPGIGVDTEIIEGKTDAALNKGAWRRPHTSDNPESGNMVISAHRYLYTSGPKTFFYLDQLKQGDEIVLFWKGKEYDYIISKTFVVTPAEISIESPTSETTLTLYTCTPLWTASKRLVVQAAPKGASQDEI